MSSIRPGVRPLALVGEQETDEDSPLAGEFDGEFNGGENGFQHSIESSTLTDLMFRKIAEEE